jgi:hypothetical protein
MGMRIAMACSDGIHKLAHVIHCMYLASSSGPTGDRMNEIEMDIGSIGCIFLTC